LTTAFLGSSPIQWQILGLLSRWLLACTAWWSFRKIWPDRVEEVSWIAILFALYPGFKQQPISVVYSNGLFLLISYIASFGLTAVAIRSQGRKRIFSFILSLITYSICLFSTEYYIGLDLVRGVLIWLILNTQHLDLRNQIKKTLYYWTPYISILAIFLTWRIFIFQFPTYQPELVNTFSINPINKGLSLIFTIFKDVFTAGWTVWIEPFRFPALSDFNASSTTLLWAVIIFGTLYSWFFLKYFGHSNKPDPTKEGNDKNNWHKHITLSGVFALFAAGWPFWITGLPIHLEYPNDRFTLAFIMGSAFLLVGIIDWIIKTQLQKITILSLIFGMAIGSNYLNAVSYHREWQNHNNFFWELSWRAPDLEPGSLLLTYKMPFYYYSDNSLTAPLNLIYDSNNESLILSHYFGFIGVRLGRSIPEMIDGIPVEQMFRNASYNGSTSNSIVLFYSPPGCLRILDPARDMNLPVLPIEYQDVMHISHPEMIIPTPEAPVTLSPEMFGKEIPHTWCYYFEKADLARQQGEWLDAKNLIDHAFAAGFFPAEQSEMILYIESSAMVGEWDIALEQARNTYYEDSALRSTLCETLERVRSGSPPDTSMLIKLESIQTELTCIPD
ncbi:MAG: hypothetical protein MUO76_17355, partial [Anaerolineaceae bacterium]|nr:hypothetical protein [Anaerolineaceae bacterium]